jgi:GGDEF domain-containing protein
MAQQDWPVTFSIGVLTCENFQTNNEEIIHLADSLMYGVKTRGKNAVAYAVAS